jgi:hypothetical protein
LKLVALTISVNKNYHGANKKAFAKDSPERTSYPDVTPWILEIDLRRILRYKEHREKGKMLRITEGNVKKLGSLERVVQKLRTS